jgi:hypothetical protein
MDRPLANSYWVVPGKLLAGEHPAGRVELPNGGSRVRALELVAAGISCFVDLTEEGECVDYQRMLPPSVTYLRRSIRDQQVPRRVAHMRRIQDEIASALAAGHKVYVHCRAGIGRTGTVAGCFLVEQGRDGEQALSERTCCGPDNARGPPPGPRSRRPWSRRLTSASGHRARALGPRTARRGPGTGDGARSRRALDPLAFSDRDLAPVRELRERFQGAMQGLAVGDALAAATQFRRSGSFAAVGDMLEADPSTSPRGAWSDDTAMALCLAESLSGVRP